MKTKTKSAYTSQVMVTFTPEQKKALEKYTKERGLSMASFIRYEVLKEINSNIDVERKNPKPRNKFAKFAGKLNLETTNQMISDIYKSRNSKK